MNSFIALMALSALTAPQEVPVGNSGTVIVTAKSLKATENALKECLAASCPPDREIAAALAHAENLFVEGDYQTARRTLLNSIGRVDRYAAQYPTEVAGIWRAQARIAAHLGKRDPMRIGQFESLDALRAGLDRSDGRVLVQRIEVADTFAKQGRIIAAQEMYNKVARDAVKAGVVRAKGIALMRLALLDSAVASAEPAFMAKSRQSIARLIETTEPELEPYRDAARLLKVRLSAKNGDDAAIDRAIAEFSPTPVDRPILVYDPPRTDELTANAINDGTTVQRGATINFDGQWADVTFLIGADGRVRDVELLRESRTLSPEWLKPVLKSVAGRRYAPLIVPKGLDGLRRVERYTLTAFENATTGSRILARGGARIETMDLTADAAPTKRPTVEGAPFDSIPAD